MLDGNVTDTIEGSALSYKKEYIDIYSCAWGPKDDGKRFGRPGTLASKALELGVKEVIKLINLKLVFISFFSIIHLVYHLNKIHLFSNLFLIRSYHSN